MQISLEVALLAADVALAGAGIGGVVLTRRLKPASAPDAKVAFTLLEKAIQRYVPDMPPGYTWGEAFERLKAKGVDANWDAMKKMLNEYEAYRYGGGSKPVEGKDEVLTLATKLRRSSNGKRSSR